MRLTAYGRDPHMRKEYVCQPDLLLVGVDVSKAKHHACMGTQPPVSGRKFEFTPTREGFTRFEQTLRTHRVKNRRQRLLIAMEPSGIYGQALYERLHSCGYEVCLVHCQAVRNNRKTMQDGTSKTDETDAASVFDLLRQGKFFLPVVRAPALTAAYRLMRRHMALKKRGGQLRNQLRATMHLAFPELNPLIQDLTQPTALRFLHVHPTPEAIVRTGQRRFLAQWPPRCRCGQWPREQLQHIYDLATARIGLQDPYCINEFERQALTQDLADALAKHQLWLDQAMALLAPRRDFQQLLQLPRLGKPTAAALLTAIGDVRAYRNGKQVVKLAGLDVRRFASGTSLHKLPQSSHVGSAYLRHWLYHYALRLVPHDPHCNNYYQRCKYQSPGTGAGQRALLAVCDKTIGMIYRLLTDHAPYDPQKDQSIAQDYAAQRKAASRGSICLRASKGVSGGGKPDGAFGPHGDGENQSVRVGPSPLHETRTKNRRARINGKTSIDLTRMGVEHDHVWPHRFHALWRSDPYHDWPIRSTESIARGVSQQKMLAFFTEH